MNPPDGLVERDVALDDLHGALGRVRTGRGELVVVTGEAGSGKSTLVRHFLAHAAGAPLVLLGGCDPLAVPRPFGPLIDAAGAVDPVAAARLASGASRVEAFAIALTLIDGRRDGQATVFVIEDAHWADEATLDLITYLGRRISGRPALLIVTFRDDEVDVRHPLRAVLGELAPAIRCRVRLAPLSVAAVTALAYDSDVDPIELHRLTSGNPFHVTELLAAGVAELPESIRDAVLARARRLSDDGRVVLDAAAIVPGRAERWLLDAVADGADVALGIEECVARGLLVPDGGATTFRHELARLAILEALSGSRRRTFHARALDALRSSSHVLADPTRLVFHAAEADDGEAVLQYAAVAADAAVAAGAHREAAGHLERALRSRHLAPPEAVVDLLTRYGIEVGILGQLEHAVDVHAEAAALAARLGDVERQAESLTRRARQLVGLGRQAEALDLVATADALLAPRPPTRSTAMVATAMSSLWMLARQFAEAEREGQRAIELGEALGDLRIVADAQISSGIALAMSGDDAGLTRIEAAISTAIGLGDDNLVSAGHLQIGSGYGEIRRYDIALPALRTGLAFAREREVGTSVDYVTAWLARCEMETGEWDDAALLAGRLLRDPRCVGISRFVALVTLGWLRGRRGDPNTGPLLDEALALAQSTRHLQRLWPVAACRVEIAWLRGNLDAELPLLDEVAESANELGYRPAIEELAHWQRVADGEDRGSVESARTPFGLNAAGRPDLAAARWLELGCPYEEAMARTATGDPQELAAAYRIFDRLGATPMRTRTAAALRDAGAPVPRAPRPGVSNHPHGLTDREVDVLALVATGRTDREIGASLFIAPKTVGHHVSHVLAKLGVRSRAEAAVVAERLGLTPAADV